LQKRFITNPATGALKIPIAHGEGRFHADEATLNELEKNDQILFRYSDEWGNIVDQANPNGAARNIAGIRNKQNNVFGMMPHPERATNAALQNLDGLKVFELLSIQ
jgi:phosphoribosylformylglycinamidine (FGAM) synthase-like amidotransferase family enzyme